MYIVILKLTFLGEISYQEKMIGEISWLIGHRSAASRSYLADFRSRAAWNALLESQGTVSSSSMTLVGVTNFSMMTMSGFCSVRARLAGNVPTFTLQLFMSVYTGSANNNSYGNRQFNLSVFQPIRGRKLLSTNQKPEDLSASHWLNKTI